MKDIIFIQIPEKFKTEINGFTIDPSIPLPVEKSGAIEKGSLEDLTWEKIIAAMLKILAFNRDFSHIDYYRNFISAVKPELSTQLIDAGVEKARGNDFSTAEEIFLAVEGLEPDNLINLINMALLYEHRGMSASEQDAEEKKFLDKAFETYKKALNIDPSSADLHFHSAGFFLNRQNYEKAKNHFSAFLELSEGNDEYIEKQEKARAILKEIDNSSLLDSKFREAYDMIQLCREEEGIKIISDFLEKSPDVWNAWFLLGWGYRRTGRYEEGYNAFRKVLDLGERSADTLNEIAICSIELGKTGEAEKYLIEALGKEPENTKIMSNLGILHYKNGNTAVAKSYFLSALEYDNTDEIAKKYAEMIAKEEESG